MQYTVKQSCGHQSSGQMYGPSTERTSKLAWLATVPCMDCKRQSERQSAAASTSDLPALTGSEKQIAWATTLRAQALSSIESQIAAIEQRTGSRREDTPQLVTALTALKGERDARFWIDHRGESAQSLLKAVAS